MMHVFGIRVYGYLERDRDTLLAAVKSGLPWLPWDACEQEGY
jgi:TetR/AcrR family transcriptional repressor of nem operon